MLNKAKLLFLCAILIVSMLPSSLSAQTLTVSRPNLATSPSKSIDLNGMWKVAPGVEHMLYAPAATDYGRVLHTLSADTLSKRVPSKIPTPVPDAQAKLASYSTDNWIEVSVPGSLLGGLMDLGVYDDLFDLSPDGSRDENYDVNRSKVPADFNIPWWYSKSFALTAEDIAAGRFATLSFKGISYSAEVYINGNRVYNTNTSITSNNELLNKTARVGTNAARAMTGAWGPTEILSQNASNNTAYTYSVPTGTSFPGGTFPAEGCSTADRRTNWDDWKNAFQGTFRHYDVDVTNYLVAGVNNIRVKVMRGDRSSDFNFNMHDWHMTPVDRFMGVIYPVTLKLTGSVTLAHPFASFIVNEANTQANGSFFVDVSNMTNQPVQGKINAVVTDPEGKVIKTFSSDTVTVRANAYAQEVGFPVQTFTGSDLQLWWPYLSGGQPLYHVEYTFQLTQADAQPTDSLKHRFGIRQITHEVGKFSTSVNAVISQVFVNHKPIVVKGGGYTPTCVYIRQDIKTDRSVVDLVKSMGMNAIRDEGKFYNDNLYDMMDEEGIMLLTGYMCCDRNEASGLPWQSVERFIVYEQTYDQLRSLRAHPCMVMWLNGSDYGKDNNTGANAGNIAHKMLEIEGRVRWYDHGVVMISGSGQGHGGFSNLTGQTGGLEMQHSYDTVVPTFYYSQVPGLNDNVVGYAASTRGISGFISEGAGGAGIPPIESIKKFIPPENLWPINLGHQGTGTGPGNYNKWNYHACRGGGNFDHIDHFQTYMDNSFGGADSVEEWVAQAQLWQYEYQRAIYEALSKYRYWRASGFINWMLNGIRPTIMWNQFDYYMNPHGSTYGAGKANTPLHIMYDPYAKEISVSNYTFDDVPGLKASMTLYDIQGNIIKETITKDVHAKPDNIGPRIGTLRDLVVGFNPTVRDGDNWFNDASYVPFTYSYPITGTNTDGQRRRADCNGVQVIWSGSDINAGHIRPTTDVYFMRLELADAGGKVLSYNTYAVPRRESLASGTSAWQRGSASQSQDWTQLRTLPEVQLEAKVNAHKVEGKYITQTVEITNPTTSVAHGVELKSYYDTAATELCPSTYDDNLITLFPGQSRTITVTHQRGYLDGPVTIKVNCFNNLIENRPGREGNIYHPFNPVGQTAAGTTTSTPNATTNLARNRQVAVGTGTYGSSGMTTIGATPLGIANNGTALIDGDYAGPTNITAANASVRVNLASLQTFDRIKISWNVGGTGVFLMGGTPDYIRVEVSTNGSTWTPVEVFDSVFDTTGGTDNATNRSTFNNRKSRSPMTNIMFKEPQTAQYIRITPTGLTTASAAYGSGTGTVGNQSTSARGAATQWTASAFEVYSTYDYAVLEVEGKAGKVSASGYNLTTTNQDLTATSPLMARSLRAYAGRNMQLTFTPAESTDGVMVYLDGELTDLQPKRADRESYNLTLKNAYQYKEIKVVFIDGDSDDYTIGAVVEDKDALLIVAAYEPVSGKMIDCKTKSFPRTTDALRQITVKWDELLDELSDKDYKVFVWNGVSLAPVEYKLLLHPVTTFAFRGLTANGSADVTTTELTLTFNKVVPGLSANDITVTGATKNGPLGGAGPVYTLPVTVTQTGTATVSISQEEVVFSPNSRDVAVSVKQVAFSALTANGNANTATTALTITFNQAVPGFSADDITISGAGAAKAGALSGAGPVYTLPITVTQSGTVTVAIAKTGVDFAPANRTASVFARQISFVSLTSNNVAGRTVSMSIRLSEAVPGLSAADITLVAGGTTKSGELSGTGAVYVLPVLATQNETVTVQLSKAGYQFTPPEITEAVIAP